MIIQANIGELKDHLSEYIAKVQAGDEIVICKRNLPIARISPSTPIQKNKTVLGRSAEKNKVNYQKNPLFNSMAGTIQIKGDLTQSSLTDQEWDKYFEERFHRKFGTQKLDLIKKKKAGDKAAS